MSITHYRIDINLTGAGQQGANSALAKINTATDVNNTLTV